MIDVSGISKSESLCRSISHPCAWQSAKGPGFRSRCGCLRGKSRASSDPPELLPVQYSPCNTLVIGFGSFQLVLHEEIGLIDGHDISVQDPAEEINIDRSRGHHCCIRGGLYNPGVRPRILPIADRHLSGPRRNRGFGNSLRGGLRSSLFVAGKPKEPRRRRSFTLNPGPVWD